MTRLNSSRNIRIALAIVGLLPSTYLSALGFHWLGAYEATSEFGSIFRVIWGTIFGVGGMAGCCAMLSYAVVSLFQGGAA